MEVSGGKSQDSIVYGNTYNKYKPKTGIVKWIMDGFENSLLNLVSRASPNTIHEVGCGEGYWVMELAKSGIDVRGSDFADGAIAMAKSEAENRGFNPNIFSVRSVYDLNPEIDLADLIVCCEVLEHVENPVEALEAIAKLGASNVILSVPREPIWCILNLARGKYILSLGNTPGHIQHWSKRAFLRTVSQYFDIVQVKSPLPWTMVLCKPKS